MYVKLIEPKMELRPMDTEIKIRMSPPLGLYTIVSILRNDHKVVVQNGNIEEIEYDTPDIVGITVSLDVLPAAMAIASHFRSRNIPVVAGGVHITTAYSTIPQEAFDAICIGPAEGTWPDIMSDLAKGTLKSVYRCTNSFSGKDIVSPAYDLIPKDKNGSSGIWRDEYFLFRQNDIMTIFYVRIRIISEYHMVKVK